MRRVFCVTALVLAGSLFTQVVAQDALFPVPPVNARVIAKSNTAPSAPSSPEVMALPGSTTGKPASAEAASPQTMAVPPQGIQKPEPVQRPAAAHGSLQAAPLSIQKIGASTVMPGIPAEYVIIVRNQGPTGLQGVRVDDELPRNSRLISSEPPTTDHHGKLTWTLEHMDRGEERRFRVNFEPHEKCDVRVGTTTASFTVSTPAQRPLAPGLPGAGVDEIGVEVQGPAALTLGNTAEYRIQVTNTGNIPLNNVALHDELGEGMEAAMGRQLEARFEGVMAPGETRRTAPLHLKAAARGLCRNHIVVRADNLILKEHWHEVKIDEPVVAAGHVDPPPPPEPRRLVEDTVLMPPATHAAVEESPKVHEAPCAPLSGCGLRLDMTVVDDGPDVGGETIYSVDVIKPTEASVPRVKIHAILPEGVAFVTAEAPTKLFDDG